MPDAPFVRTNLTWRIPRDERGLVAGCRDLEGLALVIVAGREGEDEIGGGTRGARGANDQLVVAGLRDDARDARAASRRFMERQFYV